MTLYLSNVIVYSVQLAFLVAVAYAITAALRLRAPRTSLWFWQIVMVIAIALPLAQPRTTADTGLLFSLSSTTGAISVANSATRAPAGIDLAAMAFLIIGAGIAFRLLWLGTGLIRLRSIVADAQREPALTRAIDDIHPTPGAHAIVMISDDVEGPATIGLRRPIILLPRSVLQMSEAVQRAILCHELTHVRRRDWLATLGEELWCALLCFHPAARDRVASLPRARDRRRRDHDSTDARSPRLCGSAARVFRSAATRHRRHAVHRAPHAQPAHFSHCPGGFHVTFPCNLEPVDRGRRGQRSYGVRRRSNTDVVWRFRPSPSL